MVPFNNAGNSSCALNADEVRDRDSPNSESQYPNQGWVVTQRGLVHFDCSPLTTKPDVIEPAFCLHAAWKLLGAKRTYIHMIYIDTPTGGH